MRALRSSRCFFQEREHSKVPSYRQRLYKINSCWRSVVCRASKALYAFFARQTSKVSKPHILTCHARMKTCNYMSRKESYGAGYPGPAPLPRLRGGPRAPRRARGRAPAAPRRRGGRGERERESSLKIKWKMKCSCK